MANIDDLSVLHLVTAEEIFFTQQIETLEGKGIDCDVCVVPGAEQIDGNMANKRGLKEYIQYLPKVRRALRNGDYDIIHANYGLTAPFAVTQFRLPVVLTLWGSDVVGLDGLITKTFAWRADAVTVRSKEMQALLGSKNAHIVPSGVNVDRFHPIDQAEARRQVGWDIDSTHILFPYSPDYDRKNYPRAKRVVEKVSEKLEVNISLQTISGVDHEEVPWYINAADCMLLTSDHEGSPNTIKEAMACNVPVITTDVGDVRERLEDVYPGGIGTNDTELVNLLIDTLQSERRSNGRDAVMEVSWNRIGDYFVSLYDSVLIN